MSLNQRVGGYRTASHDDATRPCIQRDPELWFDAAADRHGNAVRKPEGWAAALCADCPIAVKDACLKWALDHRVEWGVWGGTTADERAEMRGVSNAA